MFSVAGDPARKGEVAFLMDVEAPEKTARVSITAQESQIDAIDRLARECGIDAVGLYGALSDSCRQRVRVGRLRRSGRKGGCA